MAFTVSQVTQSVMGKYRLAVIDVTADSAEGSVASGLRRIIFSVVTQKKGVSATTKPTFFDNAGTTGTVAAGFIGISGAVSTEIYRLVAFGPS